jgi:hypothetical protein
MDWSGGRYRFEGDIGGLGYMTVGSWCLYQFDSVLLGENLNSLAAGMPDARPYYRVSRYVTPGNIGILSVSELAGTMSRI